MKKWFVIVVGIIFAGSISPVFADSSHESMSGMKKAGDNSTHPTKPFNFTHKAVIDSIRTEFEVMSLANMNIKSEDGTTHHIMVKFFMEGMDHPINDAIGKIKVIGPDKKEQISSLKNYNGVFAANFTFDKQGEYGIICLFKVKGKKEVVKFWYPHKV